MHKHARRLQPRHPLAVCVLPRGLRPWRRLQRALLQRLPYGQLHLLLARVAQHLSIWRDASRHSQKSTLWKRRDALGLLRSGVAGVSPLCKLIFPSSREHGRCAAMDALHASVLRKHSGVKRKG